MIDYKELLEKYIKHVRYCEGVDFIDSYDFMMTTKDVDFTDDEILALEILKRG